VRLPDKAGPGQIAIVIDTKVGRPKPLTVAPLATWIAITQATSKPDVPLLE